MHTSLSSIPEFTNASYKPGLGVPAKQKLSKQPSDGTKEGAGTGKGVTMQQLKEDIAAIQQNSECLTQVITLLLQVRKVRQGRSMGGQVELEEVGGDERGGEGKGEPPQEGLEGGERLLIFIIIIIINNGNPFSHRLV